jgi:hypothetical protein
MKTLPKSLIIGFSLALSCLTLLHAQTSTRPPADSKTEAASPAPTAQAPDEVTNKLSELVHAGKYAEAQQLTTGLLLAYPDDQRLVKTKALLDKLVAPVTTHQPALPAVNTNVEQLTGMEKVEYDALIELARQAQQTADLPQQNTLLKQFMAQSSAFLQKHPDELLLWQLRAMSAISLHTPMLGYEAGQRLVAADSNDSNVRRLLAQLKNKGWLDKQAVEEEERVTKYDSALGTWRVAWAYSWDEHVRAFCNSPEGQVRFLGSKGADHGSASNEQLSRSGSVIEGYNMYGGVRSSGPDLRGTILASGEIRWERYFSSVCGGNGGGYPVRFDRALFSSTCYPSGWQPVASFAFVDDKSMTMAVPSQHLNSTKNTETSKYPVTLSFTKIDGAP